MTRHLVPAIGALLAVTMLWSGLGRAQTVPFSDTFRVTTEDVKAMDDALDRMFENPNVRPGAKESWKNEKSGASGSVQLLQEFLKQGFPCKRILYVIKMKGTRDPSTLFIDYCEVAEGDWKILY